MESRGLKNYLSIQDESIAFKCLLNIPMGISPAELKTYFSGCNGVTFTNYENGTESITSNIDISEYAGQVIYNLSFTKYKEYIDSLNYTSFSFFQGKLHSVTSYKYLDDVRNKEILSEYERKFGSSKVKKNKRYFMDHPFYVKSNVWVINGKSIILDPADVLEGVQFIIQNDSLTRVVDGITNSEVNVEVFTYSGSDPKEKQYISSWAYSDDEGKYFRNPKITTYCEGVGNINLKGKATGLTCTITCDDGTVVFEKSGINIKGKTTILKKDQFPDKCESKDYSNDPNNPTNSTHYILTISKMGHTLFKGDIFRDECMD
jgi:hypothetical protein